MAQRADLQRAGASGVAAGYRTIAAVQFHAECVRQKANDYTPDPYDILGAAVESHHKSKSLLTSTVLRRQETLESRSSVIFREVDEFDGDDDEEDDGIKVLGGSKGAQPPGTPDGGRPAQPEGTEGLSSLRPVISVGAASAKKLMSGDDPASLLRRMRSQNSSKHGSMSLRMVEGGRSFHGRAGSDQAAANEDDDVSIIKVSTSLRGKSFLGRPDQGSGGAADDMLAQIRGAKWASDSIPASKSFRAPLPRSGESLMASPMRSELSATDTAGAALPGLSSGAAKSFSAGKRSSALPGVSVDMPPASPSHERVGPPMAMSGRQAAPPPSKGLFSKLKQMVKH